MSKSQASHISAPTIACPGSGTGKLDYYVIFGSYITARPDPRDVGVVLVMKDDLSMAACDEPTRILFEHQRAEGEVGASPELCPAMGSGYRAAIERMQREVLDYLTRDASQPLSVA